MADIPIDRFALSGTLVFSFYESPRRYGDVTAGGLVIEREKHLKILLTTKKQ